MEILFLIVGTIFAALAYFGWREVRDIRATGKRVPGQVVAYMQQITARDDRQKFYHAVVRVETPEGPGYVKSAVGSGTPMQPLHARVDVFISAKNPKLALVDSSAINW
ncbi:MAG TPA: DUF3592 domain-containing protein, partial [Bdellovibrionales bacterium]|nr:DUF3592 domain-containing protein [Bdellovibrionales bacterium]